MTEEWVLQSDIKTLQTNIESSITKLKNKLTSKNISYSQNASLRTLIGLIPNKAFTPIHLFDTLYNHTTIKLNDSQILFGGGYGNSSSGYSHKVYDINARAYITKANMPVQMTWHGAAIWGGQVTYCGGSGDGYCNYRYVVATNTFTRKANMPEYKCYHEACATSTFVLISGGYYTNDSATQYSYNYSADYYESKSNMYTPSDYLSGAWVRGNIVLFNGGNDSNNRRANWIFDISADYNSVRNYLNYDRCRHDSVRINSSSVLLVGGTYYADVDTQTFNIDTNTHTYKKTAPHTFTYHTVIDVGEEFLISGGYQGSSYTSRQYAYDVTRDEYRASVNS